MTGISLTAGGGGATAVFRIATGCSGIRVSLGGYAVDASGGAALAAAAAGTYAAGGPYTLSTRLPSCLYRAELVLGDLRSPLPVRGYGGGELARRDGGAVCPPSPSPPPAPSPSPGGGDDGHGGGGHGHGNGHGNGHGDDHGRGHDGGDRPGNGSGDGNHDHSGPPGHSKHGGR